METDSFGMPTEDLEEIKRLLEDKAVPNLSAYMADKANEWKTSIINIAVCGETYVGKSTFINKLRGVGENDDGYAPVGIGDTTLEPTPYRHPKNENLVLWDLPGVGTLSFPRDKSYLSTIQIEKYDFFLICSDQCFSENDSWLAAEAKRIGKSFFFVRTKLDEALSSATKDDQSIAEIVPRLYKSCLENVENAGIKDSQIFVISNYNHEVGQFDDLVMAILEILPSSKKEAILLTIGPLTHQIIREKKKMLQNRALLKGFLPAFSTVPVVGGYFDKDVKVIEEELVYCMTQFGLDDNSLDRISCETKQNKERIKSCLSNYHSLKETDITEKLLTLLSLPPAEKILGEYKKYLPWIKLALKGMLAYGTCVYFLRQQIELMEKDAHVLVDMVIENHST